MARRMRSFNNEIVGQAVQQNKKYPKYITSLVVSSWNAYLVNERLER